jgi:hypothetical protein
VGEALVAGSGPQNTNRFLAAATGCILLSALALGGGVAVHIVGYVLGSLLAFSLIALFRRRAFEQSLTAGIGVPHWIKRAAAGILAAGLVLSIIHAWFIASHFS